MAEASTTEDDERGVLRQCGTVDFKSLEAEQPDQLKRDRSMDLAVATLQAALQPANLQAVLQEAMSSNGLSVDTNLPIVARSVKPSPARGRISSISVKGPDGHIERIRVTPSDTPEALEHCLRSLFHVHADCPVGLRDNEWNAVPLGPGLHESGSLESEAGLTDFILDVGQRPDGRHSVETRGGSASMPVSSGCDDDLSPVRGRLRSQLSRGDGPCGRLASQSDPVRSHRKVDFEPDAMQSVEESPATFKDGKADVALPNLVPPDPLNHSNTMRSSELGVTGKWQTNDVLQSECEYWTNLTSSWEAVQQMKKEREMGAVPTSTPVTRMSQTFGQTFGSEKSIGSERKFRQQQAIFDSSPIEIESIFNSWTEGAKFVDGNKTLSLKVLQDKLETELHLVLTHEQIVDAVERVSDRFTGTALFQEEKGLSQIVFASLWQRLCLGACCAMSEQDREVKINIIEYDAMPKKHPKETPNDENKFLFGGHRRDASRADITSKKGPKTRWGWVEGASPQFLAKIGVKFFLHPLATEDLLSAAIEGSTKIDRYRHQYFVSLEVYALDAAGEPDEKVKNMPVGRRITRSTMSLVATGNPPTRSSNSSTRDWLITIINDVDQGAKAVRDPLDRFKSNRDAARKILKAIKQDLWDRKRVREYQADFLLYSVIDKAAEEMTPIYSAYGRRLRDLQQKLDSGKLRNTRMYVDEVLKLRLEIQELRQWVAQMRRIVRHLESDCSSRAEGSANRSTINDVPWNFGAYADSQGKSIVLFLRHTSDYLDQAEERLGVLDDLAKTFAESSERQKSDFMNEALFVLTVATVVMLPAQFLAGVFGMNFEGMDILTWKHGYTFFWFLSIVVGLCMLALLVLGMRWRKQKLSRSSCWNCCGARWICCRCCCCARQKREVSQKFVAEDVVIVNETNSTLSP